MFTLLLARAPPGERRTPELTPSPGCAPVRGLSLASDGVCSGVCYSVAGRVRADAERDSAGALGEACPSPPCCRLTPAPQGGRIIFFQSVAVLGYCLFPLDVAALLCLAWRNKVYQSVLLLCSALWSLRCSVPFIAATVSERRRALAVYPVLLLYTSIGALALSVSS